MRRAEEQRSPTRALLFGLIITLAAVVAYSAYITVQISGLRKLQSEMVERNRRDSLQLLRLQNDLNSVALAMRDMLDSSEPYPISAWSAQFARLRGDIDAALTLEEQNASAQRTEEQRDYLRHQLTQFWDAMDRMFALASNGKEAEAKEQIRLSLQARQAALSTAVSRLLVENNEGEQRAAGQIDEIYTRVQRQVYLFFAATLVAIVLTSLYLIRTNREIFARLAALSRTAQRIGAEIDLDAGIDTAAHFPRAARRVRPGAYRDRLAAGAAWKSSAGRVAVARGFAGSAGDRAIDAEQYPRPVAGAASGAAGRARAGEHVRLVHPDGVASDGAFVAL